MLDNINQYLTSCSACATFLHSCFWKAYAVAMPSRPWSHLTMDTDQSETQGNTVILIDWLFKFLWLRPVSELPMAFYMAEIIFQHEFWYFSVAKDNVRDQGKQFTSQALAGFIENLGVSVNLTSGYHPKANGQVYSVFIYWYTGILGQPGSGLVPQGVLRQELGRMGQVSSLG